MPTIDLKARGIVLAYEDSGVPSNSTDYTTVFLIHPFLFNARESRALQDMSERSYLNVLSLSQGPS